MQLPTSQTSVGNALRLPLKLIPRGQVVPILFGPLRGVRWVVGHGNHGYWLGTYERHMQDVLVRYLKPGTTALDLGAHYGFYTLLMARLVGSDGQVIAFEPTPPNAATLRQHVALNPKLAPRISVMECAVGSEQGETLISYPGQSSSSGASIRLTHEIGAKYSVPITTLDSLSLPRRISLIKIDVEWAEGDVLRGARRLLSTSEQYSSAGRGKRPAILIACHSGALHREVSSLLDDYGYRTEIASAGPRDFDAPADLLAVPR